MVFSSFVLLGLVILEHLTKLPLHFTSLFKVTLFYILSKIRVSELPAPSGFCRNSRFTGIIIACSKLWEVEPVVYQYRTCAVLFVESMLTVTGLQADYRQLTWGHPFSRNLSRMCDACKLYLLVQHGLVECPRYAVICERFRGHAQSVTYCAMTLIF